MQKFLLITVVALAPLPALPQKVGHRVIVIADKAALWDGRRVVDSKVPRGYQLLIEGVGTDKNKLKLLGQQVWVNRSDVFPLALEIGQFPKPVRRLSNVKDEMVVVIAKEARLKRASDDLATVHRGDQLTVRELDRDRYLVSWRGAEGWVSRREAIPFDLGIDYFTVAIERDRNAADLVARGRLWAEQADFDNAIGDLNEAIKLQPKFANAYVGRADAWYAQGKLGEALADFDEAIRIDPANSVAYGGRGIVWHMKGDLDEAIADYAEAIRLDPTDATTHFNQAALFSARGDFAKALASLTQAIRIDPNNPTIDAGFGALFAIDYTERGRAFYRLSHLDKAIARYDAAIRHDPANATLYLNRAAAWLIKNEFDRAIADYDLAIQNDSTIELAFVLRGLAWEVKGDLAKAAADYSEVVRLNPKNVVAYLRRGSVRLAQSNAEKAIKDLAEAIRLDPTRPCAYVSLAAAYAEVGQFDKAVEWQTKAIELAPEAEKADFGTRLKLYQNGKPYRDDADAFVARGNAHRRLSELDKALADYDVAIRLDPKNVSAYINRGSAWNDNSEYDKALADYDEAIRLAPKNPAAYIGRGKCWYGELDKALADYNKAIRLDPKNPEAYVLRGKTWERIGEFQKALGDYDDAIRLDQNFANAHKERAWIRATCWDERYRNGEKAVVDAAKCCELTDWEDPYCLGTLAAAYAQSGEFDKAVKLQKKAIELAPDNDEFESWLKLYQEGTPYREAPPPPETE